MSEIYDGVKSVCVWIGEADSDSKMALDFIKANSGPPLLPHLPLQPSFNASINPETFGLDTPVIVTKLNHIQAGEHLGVGKVKGGNRMTTFLVTMCIIVYPPTGKARVWLAV
ncbi:hypothetical protein K432DRAFT_406267 [Lepidopterella palustris CBS 459.81]|uniref:Uncharacterized protein n=1 Tax=Lepidopterella palustris CBS 459.81 TaxID=1314670 RepID=A0A8E2E7A7_9PEZI|nr:hypothetical protein K432DRAFT_406267 [Lepidopterella palustris CBS 459.81]